MKVWIENPFDNLPLEGFRPQRYWLMASAFTAAGHEVTYWTSDFSHSLKAPRRLQGDFFGPPFAIRLVKTRPYSSNVSIARAMSHRRYASAWLEGAMAEAAKEGAPDIVIASAPPLSAACAALGLRKALGCRVVVDVMDAWPQTFRRLLPRALKWAYPIAFAPLSRMARRAYRGADLVTGVCDGYGQMARSAGASSYYRAYHGIRLSAPAKSAPHDGFRLVYAGGMGRTYDLETVVRALAEIEGATLTIAGADAAAAAGLRSLASSLGCADRLFTPGYLSSAELEGLLRSSDIGLVPMARDSLVGIPYKLADYSAASLATASSLSGESAELLSRYRAGVVYAPSDAAACARAIREIADDLAGFKRRARAMAESEFDAAKIYSDYVAVITRLRR